MIRKPVAPILALLLLAATPAVAGAAGTKTPSDSPTFEPAPMPNHDLFAPVQRASEEPRVNPTVFKPSTQFRGDGLLPGSTSQSYEERHMLPGYGVNLSVPLK
jgi:hypothetical protein